MRLKKLQKQLGNKLDLKLLRSALEKQKNLLRVRTTQQKALVVVRTRKQADRDYTDKGPSSLTKRTSTRTILSENQFRETASFWSNLWETETEYLPTHPVLAAWREDTRERSKREAGCQTPDRERAWNRALAKMKGWKAPGPDGIAGFWWKAFPMAKEALKDLVWAILDQESEVPEWMVKGRTVLLPKSPEWGPGLYR